MDDDRARSQALNRELFSKSHFDTNFLIQTIVAGSPADAKVHS
jgi:hypothetical protein